MARYVVVTKGRQEGYVGIVIQDKSGLARRRNTKNGQVEIQYSDTKKAWYWPSSLGDGSAHEQAFEKAQKRGELYKLKVEESDDASSDASSDGESDSAAPPPAAPPIRPRSTRGRVPAPVVPPLRNARADAARRRMERQVAQNAGSDEAGNAAGSGAVLNEVITALSSSEGRVALGDLETLEKAMVDQDVKHFFRRLKGVAAGAKNNCDDAALVIADDHVFLLDDARDQLQAFFGDGALDAATRAELEKAGDVLATVLLGGVAGDSVDHFHTRGAGLFRAFNVMHAWQPVVSMPVAAVAFVLREILDGRDDDLAGKQLVFLAASCHGLLPTVVGSSALAEAVAALRSAGELPEEGPVDTASLKGLLAAALGVSTPEAVEKLRTERIYYEKGRYIARELAVDVLGRPAAYSLRALQGLVDAVEDGRRPDHGFLDILEVDITVVELWRAPTVLQSIDGADAQKLDEAQRKLATLDAGWVVVALSPKEPGVWAAPDLVFGERVPLVNELEEVVRGAACATILDSAAALRGVDAIVGLIIGGGGSDAALLRAEGYLKGTISGKGLLQSLGVSHDHRYAAAFGCVAGAGALRSCLDSAFDAGAVRLALVALASSGNHRTIMPSVAEAHAFDDVRAVALALDPFGSFAKVQIEVIADAFNVTTPDQRALDAFEARRASAVLATGRAALAVVSGRSGFANVEDLEGDLKMGDRGTVYRTLFSAAKSADTTVMKLTVHSNGVPMFDPLLDEVQLALGDMDAEERTSCVQMTRALLLRACSLRNLRDPRDSFTRDRHIGALGTTAACSAVLLVAEDADRGLVLAILASLFGVQGSTASGMLKQMLMPSAFKSEEVREAKVWLELCGMFPRGASLRRTKMLLGALLDGASRADLYKIFDEMVEAELASAVRERNPFADAETVRAAIGETSSSDDDEPHEGDTYGTNQWWRKKAEQAARVAARRMVAGSKMLSPEHADHDYYKSIRDMAETPFTPSPPSTPDWLLNAESVERAFEAAGREDLRKPAGPKRGAAHNEGVSPAKAPPAPKNRDA